MGGAPYDERWPYQGGGGGQSLYDIIDLGGGQRAASYGHDYGSQFQGGGSHDYGGAGGGGWYGGGSGQYIESNTMGGGGGGSGYVGGVYIWSDLYRSLGRTRKHRRCRLYFQYRVWWSRVDWFSKFTSDRGGRYSES